MDLPEATLAVLEELKRMRRDGVRDVYIEKETIKGLEDALGIKKNTLALDVDSFKRLNSSVSTNTEVENLSETKVSLQLTEKPRKKVKALGVEVSPENAAKFSSPPELSIPVGDKRSQWDWLENEIKNCSISNSELGTDGQIILGRGDLDSELFFCGEAPNDEDEKTGLAFGGQSGELLGKVIEAMGFAVSSVYITNILHWRPKHELEFGHRPPTQSEIQFAMPFLRAQLSIIKPKVIISLGKIATDGFLGFDSKRRLGDLRGNWNNFEGIPLMVTYHPSYLLHNPSKSGKRKVWEDMLKIMEKVGSNITEKQLGFFL